MPNFIASMKTLIEMYGLDSAMDAIAVMLTQEIETIEELTDCLVDEISYATESAE